MAQEQVYHACASINPLSFIIIKDTSSIYSIRKNKWQAFKPFPNAEEAQTGGAVVCSCTHIFVSKFFLVKQMYYTTFRNNTPWKGLKLEESGPSFLDGIILQNKNKLIICGCYGYSATKFQLETQIDDQDFEIQEYVLHNKIMPRKSSTFKMKRNQLFYFDDWQDQVLVADLSPKLKQGSFKGEWC